MYSHGDIAFMFWGGPAFRRGLARGFVPVTFAWCGAVIGYWVAALNGGSRPHPPQTATFAGLAAIAWFGIGVVLAAVIVLFNRPKLIVRPGSAPSRALAEWRASRARKRR